MSRRTRKIEMNQRAAVKEIPQIILLSLRCALMKCVQGLESCSEQHFGSLHECKNKTEKKTKTPGSPKQSAEYIKKKTGPVTSSYWFHCSHAQLVRYLRLLARCCELAAFHSLAVRVQQPHRSWPPSPASCCSLLHSPVNWGSLQVLKWERLLVVRASQVLNDVDFPAKIYYHVR